jgi:hypothetical protein
MDAKNIIRVIYPRSLIPFLLIFRWRRLGRRGRKRGKICKGIRIY